MSKPTLDNVFAVISEKRSEEITEILLKTPFPYRAHILRWPGNTTGGVVRQGGPRMGCAPFLGGGAVILGGKGFRKLRTEDQLLIPAHCRHLV